MEKHDWIVKILVDVADYAEKNDLKEIAKSIKDANVVAIREMSSANSRPDNSKRPNLTIVR